MQPGYHPFRHFLLITKHRHMVISNGFHCGIFWHCLRHDLSKYSPKEFHASALHFAGNHSPVYEERLQNGYFSIICQHHTKRNKHHWEYWTDFFCGRIVISTMPWVYATEYVCDVLSASKNYNPKEFKPETALLYFQKHSPQYYMTQATRTYIEWCLTRYRDYGFKGLKKKDTKAKYKEICSRFPKNEMLSSLQLGDSLIPG